MKPKYTSGSRIHKAIYSLSLCPKTAIDLRRNIDFQESMPRMFESVINPAIEDGLISSVGEMLYLTQRGQDKLAEMGPPRQTPKATPKISKMEGTYTGSDLRQLAVRPGAYDFLQHPSLIGGRRYERPDQTPQADRSQRGG